MEESRTREQIIATERACETAPNGTGQRCTCSFDCANYWLRAFGHRVESAEG